MSQLEISVRGTGSTIRPAERALLSLTAASPEVTTPAEASAVVTATANTIRDVILPLCSKDENTGCTSADAAIVHYSMSTMDTSKYAPPCIREQDGSTSTAGGPLYSARVAFTIKFQDFAALNTIATQFSAMDHVRISDITWSLTDITLEAIKGGARKKAAIEAIQKARDHAEVFAGIEAEEELKKRVRPVTVSEERYYAQSTRPHLHVGKGQRGRRAVREELQFEPEDVKMEVVVNAKFVVDL
ncbi:hypothetical protein GQ43DRAFT_463339 [Delitschia confertaspora ATCC 74209]|uniref:SIMPL domain-containing protein n=1 Tax=Delitschia confertaspora ATCC 74209 TaxID=1513339 RepID=A0A9P4JKR8_9PLEO|nr:hypothetical protein GQ43DRAFT_463339 [Delitschia confertaspora ATCC 74209]